MAGLARCLTVPMGSCIRLNIASPVTGGMDGGSGPLNSGLKNSRAKGFPRACAPSCVDTTSWLMWMPHKGAPQWTHGRRLGRNACVCLPEQVWGLGTEKCLNDLEG